MSTTLNNPQRSMLAALCKHAVITVQIGRKTAERPAIFEASTPDDSRLIERLTEAVHQLRCEGEDARILVDIQRPSVDSGELLHCHSSTDQTIPRNKLSIYAIAAIVDELWASNQLLGK